jgi:DNA (cytosine-5)-methyltransferase 1
MSFFTGAAMFDLALIRAGMQRVGACEIDRFARKVCTARLGAPDYFPDDITKIVASEIPDADVWIGGSPCQDFSIAGARAGMAKDDGESTRSGLLLHWLELAKQKKPQWIIIENVPGMLTGRDEDEDGSEEIEDGADAVRDMAQRNADGSTGGSVSWFGAILGAMAEAGFRRIAWRVLDGQYFGVAQRRRRVFIVGSRGDGDPREVLFEPEGMPRDPPARGEAGQGAAGRSADGSGGGRGARPVAIRGREDAANIEVGSDTDPAFALRASAGGSSRAMVFNWQAGGTKAMLGVSETHASARGRTQTPAVFVKKTRRSAGPNGEGESWGLGPSPTLNVFDNGGDKRATVLVGAQCAHDGKSQFNGNQAVASGHVVVGTIKARDWKGVDSEMVESGRVVASALSTAFHRDPTVDTMLSSGRGVRRLTPMECERLQGLPDGWTCLCGCAPYSTAACVCPDGPRYRAIGNGGVVPCVEWIARRLVAANGAKR